MRWALIAMASIGCGRIGFADLASGDGGGGDGNGALLDSNAGVLNPIAWWKLDEASGSRALDSIGNAHGDLAAMNGGELPSWDAMGHVNGGLSFVGDGDVVDLGRPPSLANLPAVSLSAWIYPLSVVDDGRFHCIFDKGSGSAGWVLFVADRGTGTLSFDVYLTSSTVTRTTMANAISPNRWSHVVVTYGGAADMTDIEFYLDGVTIPAPVGGSGTLPRPNDANIETRINCTSSSGMTGRIDEVLIFDRVLTPNEVLQLYAS